MSVAMDLDSLLARKGLKREDLKRQIKEKQLHKIAVRVSDWKGCGPFLGISKQDIDDIECDERKTSDKRFALFIRWKRLNGEEATYLKLAEALVGIGRRDLVEDLINQMNQAQDTLAPATTPHGAPLSCGTISVCRSKI